MAATLPGRPDTSSSSPKAVLFGASILGQYAANVLAPQFSIVGFVDNDRSKWGGSWAGLPVHPPSFLRQAREIRVVISSSAHAEIALQLQNMGVSDYVVFSAKPQIGRIETKSTEDVVGRMHKLRTSLGQTLSLIHGLGHRPGTLIDVGVAFGTPELLQAFPEADLIMVEPLEEFRPHIERIASERKGSRSVFAAAGARDGVARVAVTADKTTSALGNSVLTGAATEEREVNLVRVDTLCTRFEARPPYVIKIDVQGHELEVLNGCRGVLKDTSTIVMEVNFFSFTPEIPEVASVVMRMHELGFAVYDIVGGHNRPLDFARAQADIVFVREDADFRRDRRWGTPADVAAFLDRKRQNPAYRELMGNG